MQYTVIEDAWPYVVIYALKYMITAYIIADLFHSTVIR